MLAAFTIEGRALRRLDGPLRIETLQDAAWIDLVDVTAEEAAVVEDATGLRVASRADLQEIESSSRLGFADGALYLSTPAVTRGGPGDGQVAPIGFALNPRCLLTIRFAPSRAIEDFVARAEHPDAGPQGPAHIFVGLLEAMVDRLADRLEQITADLDAVSRRIFQPDLVTGRRPRQSDATLRDGLKVVGQAGDLVSHIRDSLLGIGRLVPYAEQMAAAWMPADLHPRLVTLRQDIQSLSDYDAQVLNKVQLLLDATLGFINIAQNNIMKILTVVSVVGIPPTLVASIYGMNFKGMPELQWAWGYPYGLTMIVASALVPLIWFLVRGWL
ncbi:MAG: magnesium transporter CorA family protein [Rhodospirillales bacterium]|nr:magnesium transporter CorA family protein [Rhodospirillales bacterium]